MKKIKNLLLPTIILLTSWNLQAQQLSGRITRDNSREILPGITVINPRSGAQNISDLGGNYRIRSSIGDTIIFTSATFLPDTVFVDSLALTHQFDISLRPDAKVLAAVVVDEKRNFEIDSAQRREDYKYLLNKKHPVKLFNEKRPGDEPGFSFSPVGYYSKTEKEKRKLKERIHNEEEDAYIDYKFRRIRVAQLTGLVGDSLQTFMIRFKPSYKFCRDATQQDMVLYINDKLLAFRKK